MNNYEWLLDRTLNEKQLLSGTFKSDTDFRHPSNDTLEGFSTGYHESAITTDLYNLYQNARDNQNETHTLNVTNKASIFARNNIQVVGSNVLKIFLEIADDYRTDTARTILSARNGEVAGHSGSSIRTTNQAQAHDLIREANIRLLEMEPTTTPGMTSNAIRVLFGSLTVSSIAPGVLASEKAIGTLKDTKAAANWEERRNESKRRIASVFQELSDPEKDFVLSQLQKYMEAVQPADRSFIRKIDRNRATSPIRKTNKTLTSEYQGGDYENDSFSDRQPKIKATLANNHLGAYLTQPFRTERMTLKDLISFQSTWGLNNHDDEEDKPRSLVADKTKRIQKLRKSSLASIKPPYKSKVTLRLKKNKVDKTEVN